MKTTFLRTMRVPAIALSFLAGTAGAQVLSTTNNAFFLSQVGPVTIETFTNSFHFPLGSTLNASTSIIPANGTAINPGDIQAGVTYSSSGGALLIDQGANFVGGFLDGFTDQPFGSIPPLNVVFAGAVQGFGYLFDGNFGGPNTVTVNTTSGSFTFNVAATTPGAPEFIGFYSASANITDASISSDLVGNTQIAFAVDDFTFSAVGPAATAAPEPASLTLFATGLAGAVAVARRRRRPAAK